MNVSLIIVSAPNEEVAQKIAQLLVKEKLAACVQISSPIKSFYRWKGQIEEASEYQLWIKTRTELFDLVRQKICDTHPFEVPEIISIPIVDGLKTYLNWVGEETRSN